jgi:hypothetical protein
MLRYFYILLSQREVVVSEGFVRFDLGVLLRDREVQVQFCDLVGSNRVSISVNPELCRSKKVSVFGMAIPSWEPDPLIYMPFIDFLATQGLSIGEVTMGGARPFRQWIKWGDRAIGVGLILGALMGWKIQKMSEFLAGTVSNRAFKIQQMELNRLHIRNANLGMVARLKLGIDWVRGHNGHVLEFHISSANGVANAVFPSEELNRIRDDSPWIDAVSISDQWVSVYASKLD